MSAPTLTKQGWVYYAVVVVSGAICLGFAFLDLAHQSPILDRTLLLLLAFTVLSVFATVKVPSVPVTLSVAEAFFFMILLRYGVGAGTIAVALEALVVWWRLLRRGHLATKILFTLCANCLAMTLAGSLFFHFSRVEPIAADIFDQSQIGRLVVPVFFLAVLYFTISSTLVATAIRFEQRVSGFEIWRDNFAWLSLNYLGAASLALLFVVYVPLENPASLLVIGPPIILLYLTYATSIKRVEDAKRHVENLNSLYLSTIETLAAAIDAKDQVTHGHIRRVQQLAVRLARTLGVVDESNLRAIEAASLLHDMGKLAIPDYILNKPGPLTQAEFERMKLHASVGADILSAITFPYPVVPIVRHHHEAWNGTGYPDGLAGNEIPIGARILSVVDCFDALTSDRPYRPRLNDEAAVSVIIERKGTLYDPAVVDAFLSVLAEVKRPSTSATGPGITAATGSSEPADPGSQTDAHDSFHEISASADEMLILYEIASALCGRFNLEDASTVLGRHLRRLVPSSCLVFFVYDPSADELVASYSVGDCGGAFRGLRISLGQRLTGWVGANRQTILNSDPSLDLGEAARLATPPLRSCLSTPLIADDSLVGVLSLYSSSSHGFTDNHSRIIEAVSRPVASTVKKALQFEREKRSVLHDPLTGLPHIWRLHDLAETFVDDSAAVDKTTAIVLVEVDKLPLIVQECGRDAANTVLADVAGVLRRHLHATEFLFRSRRDEFIIFADQVDDMYVEARGNTFRQIVSEASIASPLSEGSLTVSVSVASFPQDGRTLDSLLTVAHERLSTGRGRFKEKSSTDSVH